MMWLFIIITQILVLTTSGIGWWLLRFKSRLSTRIFIISIFTINNIALVYGLSEFWQERFHVYLVISILQGFMIYAALITAVLALLYCCLLRKVNRPKLIRAIGVVVYVGMVSLAVFNSYSPVVKRLTVITDKPLAEPLRIALVSDTHLGRWFGNRQIDRLITLVDTEQPDTVVLAGDIMNDDTVYYDKTNMHERLSKLTAPLGVYATLGNHDYFGYQRQIAAAAKNAGITVLDNQSVLLNDAVWLIGRSDDSDLMRLSAQDLVAQVDTDKPVLFLEHRPSAIDEISALPIDLHLSGHTHGGQIFPLTMLLKWFAPLAYGTKITDDTTFLVTSGYGFGAVPFRLGTRSEIWLITLQTAP